MLAAPAARAGAEYVDIYDSTIGHDVRQPSDVKWVEELILTSLAVPDAQTRQPSRPWPG
jgi:hypothetical protein